MRQSVHNIEKQMVCKQQPLLLAALHLDVGLHMRLSTRGPAYENLSWVCAMLYCTQARMEAEHMRLEVRRLETDLERKQAELAELQVGVHSARSWWGTLCSRGERVRS